MMKLLRIIFIQIAFACLLFTSNLYSQPGILDPTFGTGGKVLTTISGNAGMAIQGLVVQPDGKLVGAGYYNSGSGAVWMLARYNQDGTLDNSFGVNGIETAGIGASSAAYGAALQSDGKIISAGSTNNDKFFIVRSNSDGTLDNSFGTNGQLIIPNIPNGAQANCVSVQSDGKIIAGGFMIDNNNVGKFLLVRLNSNGQLDPSFNINGIDTTAIGPFDAEINSIAIQPDGKIIAAGYCASPSGAYLFALARYKATGGLDSSFAINGIDTISAPGTSFNKARSVALQSDGKIVAGGTVTDLVSSYFAVARYDVNGLLDPAFGVKTTTVYGRSTAYAMALQNDGKIVEAGMTQTTNPFAQNFAMVRYLTDGTLDNTFGVNGSDTTNFGNDVISEAHAIQLVNSRIYLAGTAGSNWALAAYTNNAGALPIAFINFDGVLRNNNVILNWSIVNQPNTKGFQIQKSTNGQTFTDIGFVKRIDNSASLNQYNFTDANVLTGINYYRLKQFDVDGKFTYSPVIKIDYSKFNFTIPGSPGINNKWMQLQLDHQANVIVQVIAIDGRILHTINKGNINSGTYSIPLNMGYDKPGIYIIKLVVNDQTYSKKIVK